MHESDRKFSISQYEFELPEELIAQEPVKERDQSRLFMLNRSTGIFFHHEFKDLERFLVKGDLLVINNTEVIPARLAGRKETGGKLELLVLDFPGYFNEEIQNGDVVCRCLIKSSKRTKSGTQFIVNDNLKGQILDGKEGVYSVKFNVKGNFDEILYKCGEIPLPPYIRRKEGKPTPDDVLFYQTVYASRKGAVAAPTAGLHFTKRLIERLKSKGVLLVEITLHVGYGTFLPVRVSDIREHRMHSEWYEISEASAEQVNSCKRSGSRVIAVGTTCVRALEFASDEQGMVKSGKRECNLFIYPGYRFKVINGMITNFHLPKSTLLMLVSSFAGKERLFSAYQEAIRKKYRFFSYGDAMLIL